MATVILFSNPTTKKKGKSGNRLKRDLADTIANRIRNEFRSVHLSGQLMDSINVTIDDEGNCKVKIPPQIYDIEYYKRYGVIKHISPDSYAVDVDIQGGFSGLHKDFLINCIKWAITEWGVNSGIKHMSIEFSVVK